MDEQEPAASGYEWNWEEGNAAEAREPSNSASWFDQFEQLFYGSSNGEGATNPVEDTAAYAEGAGDDAAFLPTEEWTVTHEMTVTDGGTTEDATDDTELAETAIQQAYPAYQGFDQQQPAPSMPYDYEYVDANAQATDLFNTEQCIHTYSVVNTVEEIHTPEDVLLNQCHLMSIAGEITEYEESYLQQLVLQKDPSVKEALRRYSL